jgi:iron complex outermembrane recepter protein
MGGREGRINMIANINKIFGKAALCTGLALSASWAQAQAATSFALPAQPLADSLRAVGTQTNTNVLFDPDLVTALTAPALDAELTRDEALARLLTGTGLTYELLSERTAVVAPMRAPRAPTYTKTSMAAAADLRFAQADPPASSSNAAATSQPPADKEDITEVLVTAQKREERLIDTPQSVSVLTSDSLAKLGATQFRDFADTVPGLTFITAGAGVTQISLRGVTVGNDVASTVGIYVDEVPYTSSGSYASSQTLSFDAALFDVDRIEVLRGPQGTLYGASSMGGLLKYVTKRPDTQNFGVDAQAGLSSTRHGGVSYNAAGVLNAPIVTGKLAARFSGFESHDGGYIDNLALGREDVNRSDIYGGRADFLFTPTDALSVRLTGFLQDIDRDGSAASDFSAQGVPIFDSLSHRRQVADTFEQSVRLVSNTIDYDLQWAGLTSVTSYQTNESAVTRDLSVSFVPNFARCPGLCRSYSAVGVEQAPDTKKFTQEVRLASSDAQRNGNSLEWLFGGFYTHEETESHGQFMVFDLAGQPAPNDLFDRVQSSAYEERAVFGDLTYYLTSKFDISGGIRYARNNQRFEVAATGLLIRSQPLRRAEDDVSTYLANARYHFTDRSTGYVRYATGYRPGGPNYVNVDPTTGLNIGPPTFEADRLKSYEVGIKAETEGRQYGADLAVYYIDWSNPQINVVRGGLGVYFNAPGGASVRGAELALNARPLRELTISGAFAYQDSHVLDADPDLGAREGERMPNVPRFTGNLNADYDLPFSNLQPTIGATVRYVSDRTGSFGVAAYQLPEYTTADLRTGLAFGSVNMQLYVRNLFDERAQLGVAAGVGGVAILQPRTYGISATTSF